MATVLLLVGPARVTAQEPVPVDTVRADTIRFLDSKEEGKVQHRPPKPVPAAETAIRNDAVKALTGQEPQPVTAGANEEIPF